MIGQAKLKQKKEELQDILHQKKMEEKGHAGASQRGSELHGQIQIIEKWIDWIDQLLKNQV